MHPENANFIVPPVFSEQSIRNKLRDDHDREFSKTGFLFASYDEFHRIYVSGNYQKEVYDRLGRIIDKDLQGKWRQDVKKADRHYIRLFIKDGRVKIKQGTKTIYNSNYNIIKGKTLSAYPYSYSIVRGSNGKFKLSGFEMYYGTDEKIAKYVTKQVFMYTGIILGSIIITILVI